MAVSYFVRYQGLPSPIDAFEQYYREKHLKILADFPGLRGLNLHVPTASSDSQGINADPTDFMAQMIFDNENGLNDALHSEARIRAREDFPNLPIGNAQVTHQAMSMHRVI